MVPSAPSKRVSTGVVDKDARYLQHRLPPDARASMTPESCPVSRFARLALPRVSTTSTKREDIPVPIGGSFVVAAPLGLHTV